MRITSSVTFAVALLAIGFRLAGAQMRECAPDVERFCKGVPMGGGRILECLRGHGESLSDGCKSVLGVSAPGGKGGSSAAEACRPDVIRYCRDVARDRAKVKSCLQSHAAELSDACKTAIIAHGS